MISNDISEIRFLLYVSFYIFLYLFNSFLSFTK
nr:MAG TPA: hypothetical protein [Caudoviricetes sp.]